MTAVTQAAQFLFPEQGSSKLHSIPRLTAAMPFALLSVPAAGTYYFSTSGVLKPGLLNMGILFQPHGGSISLEYTLAPQDLVMKDPASVPWFAMGVVANQAIFTAGNVVPNVAKIIAASKGIIYVSAC